MSKWRARAGRGRQHRGDAGQDTQVKAAPMRRAVVHGLENSGGHGKDAGIARRHHNDALARSGHLKGVLRTVYLDPVVAGVQHEARAFRHTGHIGDIAHNVRRLRECIGDFGRDHIRMPRAKPRDDNPSGHGRRPWPCTTMIEK